MAFFLYSFVFSFVEPTHLSAFYFLAILFFAFSSALILFSLEFSHKEVILLLLLYFPIIFNLFNLFSKVDLHFIFFPASSFLSRSTVSLPVHFFS